MYEPALIRVAADLKNLGTIRSFVQEQLLALGIAGLEADHLVLAADEVATNIILHGYEKQPGSIEVEVAHDPDTLYITLRDRAPVFNPNTMPEPDLTVPLEQRALGGMGIFLARRATDEIRHMARPGGGNELCLVKKGLLK
jgi:serine/threonine-protein kinase RsbW